MTYLEPYFPTQSERGEMRPDCDGSYQAARNTRAVVDPYKLFGRRRKYAYCNYTVHHPVRSEMFHGKAGVTRYLHRNTLKGYFKGQDLEDILIAVRFATCELGGDGVVLHFAGNISGLQWLCGVRESPWWGRDE